MNTTLFESMNSPFCKGVCVLQLTEATALFLYLFLKTPLKSYKFEAYEVCLLCFIRKNTQARSTIICQL